MSGAKVEISVNGTKHLLARLDILPEIIARAERDTVNPVGLRIATLAKHNAPVGSPESTHKKGYVGGRLRASIRVLHGAGTDTIMVGSDVSYAAFVELGTYKMKAQPYLAPAAELVKAQVQKYLRMMLEKILSEAEKAA